MPGQFAIHGVISLHPEVLKPIRDSKFVNKIMIHGDPFTCSIIGLQMAMHEKMNLMVEQIWNHMLFWIVKELCNLMGQYFYKKGNKNIDMDKSKELKTYLCSL